MIVNIIFLIESVRLIGFGTHDITCATLCQELKMGNGY